MSIENRNGGSGELPTSEKESTDQKIQNIRKQIKELTQEQFVFVDGLPKGTKTENYDDLEKQIAILESELEKLSPNEAIEVRTLPFHLEKEIRVDINSSKKYIEDFEKLLRGFGESWFSADIEDLSNGYAEALVNAMKYGNASDPKTFVETSIDLSESEIMISIKDKNPEAFNPETAFNSVDDTNEIMAAHGRGITLMKHFYPDGVSYEFMYPGNKVTLIKKNNS